MQAPVVIKPLPPQVVNERAAYGPYNLKEFIQAPDDSPLQFRAGLSSGASLPRGLICTQDGILTGIPAKGTEGLYEFLITASNEAGSIDAILPFTIQPSMTDNRATYIDKLKSQVWEALEHNLAVPELSEIYAREITAGDIYYLLERWGVIIIWDAFNLEPASEKTPLQLEGASPHYNVYDRGSCLIGAPVDLYSYERTIQDGIQTARAMAGEVYKRNWTIEMAGVDKLTRTVWVEIQHLNDQYGRNLDIINYTPSDTDIKLYSKQAVTRDMSGKMEKGG